MDGLFNHSRWPRVLLAFASVVLIAAALYWAKGVLLPVVLAILLTFVLSPLVTLLQRLHLPRLLAVLLVMVLALAFLGGLGLTVYKQMEGLAGELPKQRPVIIQKIRDVVDAGKGSWIDNFRSVFEDITREAKQTEKGKEPVRVTVVDLRGPTYLLGVASPALEVLIQAGMLIVLLAFMLMRREDLRNRLIRLWGEGSITSMTKALDDAGSRLSRFLLAQLLINGTFGVLVALGLWAIGVPYPLVWGLLAGALRYLPYVGAYIGAALPLFVAATLMSGWTPAILTLALFVVLELVTANVVEPWVFGHSIGVSEVALLISAAFWAWLWGPIGLVLSTPITALLAVLGKYVPSLEFLDVLLGDEPVLTAPVRFYQRLLARDEDEAARLVEEYHQKHCGGEVFDDIFVPALLLTAANRERGRLTEDDEHFIHQTTRTLVEDLPPLTEEERDKPECTTEAGKRWQAAPAMGMLVLGCPAHDEADELLLTMLQRLLDPAKCRLEVLSAKTLASELVQQVEKDKPAGVCVASLPPRGLTYTRYLCKRLRNKFPDLKILVLFLGREAQQERVHARLRQAGADFVATRLSECQDQLLPIVQLMALNDKQRELAATAQ